MFRAASEPDATRLIANLGADANRVRLFVGTFWTTYEYVFSGSVEVGFGPHVEPRSEGQMFRAFGKTAVVVHSRVAESINTAPGVQDFVAELARDGCENFLVFANCEDHAHHVLFPWRRQVFDVLTATMVQLDNAENLSWKALSYNAGTDAVEVAEHFHRMSGPCDFE